MMHRENFKEGSIPLVWLVLGLYSKFQGWNFLKEGRMWNFENFEGQIGLFPYLMKVEEEFHLFD